MRSLVAGSAHGGGIGQVFLQSVLEAALRAKIIEEMTEMVDSFRHMLEEKSLAVSDKSSERSFRL
eukprot:6542637-Pyramimonas_sp.AAC.1